MKRYITTPEELNKFKGTDVKIYKENYSELHSHWKFVGDVLCHYRSNGEVAYGEWVTLTDEPGSRVYVYEDEAFEITKTGLYKTRDGHKVFVSKIDNGEGCNYPVSGLVEGSDYVETWDVDGLWDGITLKTTKRDIVGEWNE